MYPNYYEHHFKYEFYFEPSTDNSDDGIFIININRGFLLTRKVINRKILWGENNLTFINKIKIAAETYLRSQFLLAFT